MLGVAGAAGAGVVFYLDAAAFDAALTDAGKIQKAFWDFTPNNQPPGSAVGVMDFLDINSHPINAPGIWDPAPGMWNPALDNVQFVSNTNPGGTLVPHGGGIPMGFSTPGFSGQDNNALWANYFVDSFDIISGPPAGDNHTGMGLDVFSLPGFGDASMVVTVFDKNDVVLGSISFTLPDIQAKQFLGIVTDAGDTIGRVDIYDLVNGAEGISSISVWQLPTPGALALLGVAGLLGSRRRRRE